jgi:glycerol-3-phosphate acyltransferase PlsX
VAEQGPGGGHGASGPAIAVDAMGGDHAPHEIIAGALAAHRQHGIRVLLTGPAARLRRALAEMGADPEVEGSGGSGGSGGPGGLRVVPAEDNLAMDEGALASLRRPRSSVAVACQLVRRGEAAAVVSAGSTGGIVATARLRLRPLPGVLRPGLAVVLPTRPGRTVLIDAGATADPKPEMLVQFGQLGVAYAQLMLGVSAPRVGLLTIGTEPGKGNKFTRRAHELLAADPPNGALPLSFAGNVEGGGLLAGELDVIVTDGFTGNVALKTLEGSVRFATAELRAAVTGTTAARIGAFLQRRSLRQLAARLDSESYGGAVLLGLGGTVVIAHGASTARAVTSACLLAADLARGEITEKITQRLGPGRGHFLRRPERLLPPGACHRSLPGWSACYRRARVTARCPAGAPVPAPASRGSPIRLSHGRSAAGPRATGARCHRGVARPGIRRRRPADPAVVLCRLPVQRGAPPGQAGGPPAA